MSKCCFRITLLLVLGFQLLACNNVGSPFREGAAISTAIPPESPFAKVKIGMGMDEVYATIGPPTSSPTTYITPKNHVPAYFGPDTSRTTAHYKGVGSITFSTDNPFSSAASVRFIDYNPQDLGYQPK
jgi:hypothetical protein